MGQHIFLLLKFVFEGSYGGYDWGSEEKNLLHHGTPVPPSYSLKNVTAKVSQKICKEISLRQVALVWGDNDVLVEAEDLARIKEEVPNIVMNFKASNELNNLNISLYNIKCAICPPKYTIFNHNVQFSHQNVELTD